jgi:hypothetical protein
MTARSRLVGRKTTSSSVRPERWLPGLGLEFFCLSRGWRDHKPAPARLKLRSCDGAELRRGRVGYW